MSSRSTPISSSDRSRSRAVYKVPARSRTRPPEIFATSARIPYPCWLPSASAVRIRKVASCIARSAIATVYTVELAMTTLVFAGRRPASRTGTGAAWDRGARGDRGGAGRLERGPRRGAGRRERGPRRARAGTRARADVGCGEEEMAMGFEHILVERSGDFVTITMNRPQRRNALSLAHMRELITAFRETGDSDAVGVVLAGHGPVFCSGHDLAGVADTDLPAIRALLGTCTELVTVMQQGPQPVVARVHGLATAAGCQLVASADLAVASEDAGFATPGGKGGWFCHTPMVAVARNVGRKRAMELALSGDVIDARTALDWGLVNQVVPAAGLDTAVGELLARVTQGSAESKGIGKQALYAQIDLDQPKAYAYAVEVMAATSQLPDAREWAQAFLDKRKPHWSRGRE